MNLARKKLCAYTRNVYCSHEQILSSTENVKLINCEKLKLNFRKHKKENRRVQKIVFDDDQGLVNTEKVCLASQFTAKWLKVKQCVRFRASFCTERPLGKNIKQEIVKWLKNIFLSELRINKGVYRTGLNF